MTPVHIPELATAVVNDMHSFGLLRFSGACNERTLEMQVVDREGKRRWTQMLRGSDLVPPPPPGVTPGPYRGHSSCAYLK
jgi:hypothetical protein